MRRRVKRLKISEHLLFQAFRDGVAPNMRCISSPIPPDARIIGIDYEGAGTAVFYIESEQFEMVDWNDAPEICPVYTTSAPTL